MAIATAYDPFPAAERGRQMGLQNRQMNALEQFAQGDRTGGTNALIAAGAPEAANQLDQYAERGETRAREVGVRQHVATGDMAGAREAAGGDPTILNQLAGMDKAALEAADQRVSKIGGVAYYIRSGTQQGTPERDELLKSSVATMVQQGLLTPDQIGNIDGSDAGLQKYEALAIGLKDQIANALNQQKLKADQEAKAADDHRQDAQFAETRRHNRTSEELQSARVARMGSGGGDGDGYGKAPSGYRYQADGSLSFIPGGPADPSIAASNRNLRPIPAAAQQGITANRNTLSKIDRAIAQIKANPKAMGVGNYLGDAIRQRTDSNGVPVRALVADIGSAKLHDRSGAAVTASESPRLMPFIPTVTDSPQAAIQKLENLRAEYGAAVDEAEVFYGEDSGYRPLAPAAQSRPQSQPRPVTAQPSAPAAPKMGEVRRGYRYKGGDPSKPQSWVKAQ